MKWVTRERARVDRIACPWLITRFVDAKPEFLFVPSDKVRDVAKSENAISYDIPDVELGHHGPRCSFDAFIDRYLRTIPFDERMSALGSLVHVQTDQVTLMPIFFQGAAYVVGANSIKNVNAGTAGTGQAWNAYQWDIT